MPPYLNILCII